MDKRKEKNIKKLEEDIQKWCDSDKEAFLAHYEIKSLATALVNSGWNRVEYKNAHLITFKGETRRLAEWARIYNIDRNILCNRLWLGWSVEEALLTPITRRKNSGNRKAVLQYDMDGNFIARWDSMKEAADLLGCKPENIGMCCQGKIKTSAGYVWKYAEDKDDG